jgi:hypothetical protein
MLISAANGHTRPVALRGADNVVRLYIGDEGNRASGVYINRYFVDGALAQGWYMAPNQGNTFLAAALDPDPFAALYAIKVFFNGVPFTGVLTEANAETARSNTANLHGIPYVGPVHGRQYLRGGVCHGVFNNRYYHFGLLDTNGVVRTVYYFNSSLAHNHSDGSSGPTIIYGNGVAGQSWELPA